MIHYATWLSACTGWIKSRMCCMLHFALGTSYTQLKLKRNYVYVSGAGPGTSPYAKGRHHQLSFSMSLSLLSMFYICQHLSILNVLRVNGQRLRTNSRNVSRSVLTFCKYVYP